MEFIKKLLFALRSIGLRAVLRTIMGSLRRDWYDRQEKSPLEDEPAQEPGKLRSAQQSGRGAYFQFERTGLQIDFLQPDLARLTWQEGREPLPYALAKTAWEAVACSLTRLAEGWQLTTAELEIRVTEAGEISFYAPDGQLLRRDLPPGFRGAGVVHQVVLRPDESVYGLGERAAALHLRPGSYRMQNLESEGSYHLGKDPLYMCIPVYLGRHAHGSYLVFYENSHYGDFRLDGGLEVAFDAGQLRYYFIPGPPARAYQRYTELTGRPALPPRWALGFHQSRWGYQSEADIRAIAAGFAEHRLPWSAIHLDIDYMDGYRCFTVDRQRYPDLAGLTADLAAQGVRVVAINDVGIKRDAHYDVYRRGLQEKYFLLTAAGKPLHALVWPGWSAFPDFTNPAVRSWWGDLYPRLLDQGIAGIWHDMNEPATFVGWGQPRLPLNTRYHMEGRGGDHREGNNLYALLNNRAGYEGLRQHRPQRRPWIVSRSGWAGQQRYAWHWTGDIESSWAALRLTIAEVLNLGLSGMPYTGPDIGGFTSSPGAELFTRWFQLAAFLPFFRSHAAVGTEPQEPWAYGEPHTGIHRRFLEMRYRLLPYWYTLAWQTAQTGEPLVRPLFWEYPETGPWSAVEDEFMLGANLLVAPVLEPQAAERRVVLPPGTWYAFDAANQVYQGPATLDLPVTLADLPVFGRGGSLVPCEVDNRLVLLIYLPAESDARFSGQVYSDAGDGYADWRLDRFDLHLENGQIQIEWQTEGDYPFPYVGVHVEIVGAAFTHFQVDQQMVMPLQSGKVDLAVFRSARFM